MKKIFLSLCLVSCSSLQKPSLSYEINYIDLKKIVLANESEDAALRKLGPADDRILNEKTFTLQYNDAKSGLPRFLLTFLNESKKIDNAIWIPNSNESEYTLKGALATFASSSFKEVPEKNLNTHHISLGAISYIDQKDGISLKYDRDHKVIEAIGFYRSDSRYPAENKTKKDETPYTF